MADNHTKKQRSYNMSQIKSKGTRLERQFFALLNESGIKYKDHPDISGKPDCLIGEKVAVFVDSDFWHGWQFSRWRDRMPKKYWAGKIEHNIKRDRQKFQQLRRRGYTVIRIWEHTLKNKPQSVLKIIKKAEDAGSL